MRSSRSATAISRASTAPRPGPTSAQFDALFQPRGVLVTGASTHPGKFGFVSLHNLLAAGYEGRVFGTNLQGEEVLGIQTVADVADLPDGEIDLVFVCTPASANPDLLRACAAKGVKAAFLTSAGYGEAGDEGRRAEAELVALADELGILLAGPNGQGVVSTPVKLCAQIVAPYPPAGRIGVASQSGNFVSSFLNFARATGVGISRAVSAGNAAAVSVADYLDHYANDPATSVGLAYVEGITDGRALLDRLAGAAARKPLVLVKGGLDRERGAGSGQPHRRPRRRRQGVRRRVPRRRDHPGDDGRGGVRGGGHVRHPALAGRTQRRRADDRGGMGRRDGGRHRTRRRPAPADPAGRPARRHRRPAAATVEPQQPGRLRRRRDRATRSPR